PAPATRRRRSAAGWRCRPNSASGLPLPQRQVQGAWMGGGFLETIRAIEAGGLLVQCVDDDYADAELFTQRQRTGYGVGHEMAAMAVSVRIRGNRQPSHADGRNRVCRHAPAVRFLQVRQQQLRGRKGVVAEDARRLPGVDQHMRGTDTVPVMLDGLLLQVGVEDRFSASERRAVMAARLQLLDE